MNKSTLEQCNILAIIFLFLFFLFFSTAGRPLYCEEVINKKKKLIKKKINKKKNLIKKKFNKKKKIKK